MFNAPPSIHAYSSRSDRDPQDTYRVVTKFNSYLVGKKTIGYPQKTVPAGNRETHLANRKNNKHDRNAFEIKRPFKKGDISPTSSQRLTMREILSVSEEEYGNTAEPELENVFSQTEDLDWEEYKQALEDKFNTRLNVMANTHIDHFWELKQNPRLENTQKIKDMISDVANCIYSSNVKNKEQSLNNDRFMQKYKKLNKLLNSSSRGDIIQNPNSFVLINTGFNLQTVEMMIKLAYPNTEIDREGRIWIRKEIGDDLKDLYNFQGINMEVPERLKDCQFVATLKNHPSLGNVDKFFLDSNPNEWKFFLQLFQKFDPDFDWGLAHERLSKSLYHSQGWDGLPSTFGHKILNPAEMDKYEKEVDGSCVGGTRLILKNQ